MHRNSTPLRCELDPVLDEIDQHLENAVGIAVDKRNPGVDTHLQPNFFFARGGLHHGDGLPDQISKHDAARFNADFSGLCPAGFQQIANHGSQLVDALQNRFKMIALFRADFAGQAVEQDGGKLVNAGQRGAQFMRNMRQKLILELQLLLAAHLQGTQQRLAFHGVAHGPIQSTAGDGAFHQIVLHALMEGLDGECFVVLSRQDDDGHIRGFLQHLAKGFRSLAVRKVQVEQDDGGRFVLEGGKAVGQPIDAVHVNRRLAFHQPQAHQIRVSRVVFDH